MEKYSKIEIVKKDEENNTLCIISVSTLSSISRKDIKMMLKEYNAVPVGMLPKDKKGVRPLAVALSEDLEEYELKARITFMQFNLKRPIKAYVAPHKQIKDAIKIVKKQYRKYCKS